MTKDKASRVADWIVLCADLQGVGEILIRDDTTDALPGDILLAAVAIWFTTNDTKEPTPVPKNAAFANQLNERLRRAIAYSKDPAP